MINDNTRQDPLRVAVIGTGFGGRVQIPGLLGFPETNVVALCGRSEQKTRDIAEKFGIRAVYTDYEQLLVDVLPDVVSIVTPPKFHYDMVMAALQIGAHVLCEKPFAMNATEGQDMLNEAIKRRRIHVIDHEFRYIPARYYQHVLVDQGYIGEPVLLEATLMSSIRWAKGNWNWWMDADMGGGILGALGSHFIDSFRWLSHREVKAVTASLNTTPQYKTRPMADGSGDREVTSDDTATVIVEMEGGLRGIINLSAVAGGEVQRLAIHGTEGALVVENDSKLWGRRQGSPLEIIPVPPEYEPPLWVPDENMLLGPFVKLMGLMVDEIRERALIKPASFADGLAVQRVLDAARQSSREHSRVEISE
jgi:predicted dehydrogenase